MRTILATAAIFALFVMSVQAMAMEDKELQRLNSLFNLLAAKTDLQFERNGSKYKVARAVSHLKSKLRQTKDKISTCEEFIDGMASASSATGKPYHVILSDGTVVDAKDYFYELLEKVDADAS
jgi:hypothetical protein